MVSNPGAKTNKKYTRKILNGNNNNKSTNTSGTFLVLATPCLYSPSRKECRVAHGYMTKEGSKKSKGSPPPHFPFSAFSYDSFPQETQPDTYRKKSVGFAQG